jgi:hypothetical protein
MCGAVVLLGTMTAAAQPPEPAADVITIGPGEVVISANAAIAEPGEYWLGVECMPVPPPLRAQLGLPENQGLLVESVMPESPAAKAGIARYDVLLAAAGKPLASPRELIQAVETAKEAKLAIEVLHEGKKKTIEATPAKRPEEARRKVMPLPDGADWETVQKWIERMRPGEQAFGQPPLQFRFFHPGAILPKDVLVQPPLPVNMSIVVSKEGDQPAKIVVKRGDDKWEVTEKELDKLPEDVRPYVERMLGRGGPLGMGIIGGALNFVPELATPALPQTRQFHQVPVPPPHRKPSQVPVPPPLQKPSAGDGRLEKRLDEMNRRMDQLFKSIEELRQGRGHRQAPEKAEKPEATPAEQQEM